MNDPHGPTLAPITPDEVRQAIAASLRESADNLETGAAAHRFDLDADTDDLSEADRVRKVAVMVLAEVVQATDALCTGLRTAADADGGLTLSERHQYATAAHMLRTSALGHLTGCLYTGSQA